jgi:hypothetical protein
VTVAHRSPYVSETFSSKYGRIWAAAITDEPLCSTPGSKVICGFVLTLGFLSKGVGGPFVFSFRIDRTSKCKSFYSLTYTKNSSLSIFGGDKDKIA